MGAHPLIMHVAPLSAFEGGQGFQLDIVQHPQQLFAAFPPIGAQVGHFRINVDAVLMLRRAYKTRRANLLAVGPVAVAFHNIGLREWLLHAGKAAVQPRLNKKPRTMPGLGVAGVRERLPSERDQYFATTAGLSQWNL